MDIVSQIFLFVYFKPIATSYKIMIMQSKGGIHYEKKIIENGIEYVRDGDYYVPNLKVPEGTYNIGKYGRLHSIFIKENRPTVYSMKMLDGTWLAEQFRDGP